MTTLSQTQLIAVSVFLPCFLGWWLSPQLVAEDLFHRQLSTFIDGSDGTSTPTMHKMNRNDGGVESPAVSPVESLKSASRCDDNLKAILSPDLLEGLSFAIHRNGDSYTCSQSTISVDQAIAASRKFHKYCPVDYDRFDVDAFLTELIGSVQELASSCGPTDIPDPPHQGFIGHCDRGTDRTPMLHDHKSLVPVPSTRTLPCRYHTREGLRITSLEQLAVIARNTREDADDSCADESGEACSMPEFHLYAVPAGRVFMFAPRYVGEIFELPHVEGSMGQTISLKVLSVSPRVFDIFHFFSKDESDTIVAGAIAQKAETHRIKRSTTGATGHHLNKMRTSESGFDTHGKTAVLVKKRCFNLLGFGNEYIEGYGDGLQILRYNLTTAYMPHMDYMDDPKKQLEHDYDSEFKGGNRYATILMYMSDLEDGAGGETVFPHGKALDNTTLSEKEALEQLRSSDYGMVLDQDSWEEKMVAKCRSKLAIRPNSARAVLFYSQNPNGSLDNMSLHGGCPVLHGTKWAANLWMWNTIRDGYPGNPRNEKKGRKETKQTEAPVKFEQKSATFVNSLRDPTFHGAKLYFSGHDGEMFWSDFGKESPRVQVNTYETHVWNVKVDGAIVKTWTIGKEPRYNFVL